MKYLKSYNESVRSLMKPKSREEILDSLLTTATTPGELIRIGILYESLDILKKGLDLYDNKQTKSVTRKLFNQDDRFFILFALIQNPDIKNNDMYQFLIKQFGLSKANETLQDRILIGIDIINRAYKKVKADNLVEIEVEPEGNKEFSISYSFFVNYKGRITCIRMDILHQYDNEILKNENSVYYSIFNDRESYNFGNETKLFLGLKANKFIK